MSFNYSVVSWIDKINMHLFPKRLKQSSLCRPTDCMRSKCRRGCTGDRCQMGKWMLYLVDIT